MLWLRARSVRTTLLAGWGVFVILLALLHDTRAILPSLTGTAQVALSLFAPVVLIAALMQCLESRLTAAELSAVRRVRVLDTVLVLTTMVAALLGSAAVSVLTGEPQAATAGRNTFFLTGLMLCGKAVMGRPGVMVPVAWLLAVVGGGFRSSGDAYPWTIVPEPLGAWHAAAGAGLVFALGVAVEFGTVRRPA
ncbi:hypothetical protein SSP531S_51140 [Streptomyces spongiicola]|uniref:ABC transporter permease n=1 Tax=Streptomyces spongiicola TaxID=1690221 RepID=A0A2S1YY30_9ACTN|nr:hypothetical protein [Streptomyces spongiicola]AWK09024.1 hypothetical protein DDQ41_08925 [Streptomyces spongiicola]GBQ03639.1 hypothetical protein SSP531S_51140 [Streptomyces spongiicola]